MIFFLPYFHTQLHGFHNQVIRQKYLDLNIKEWIDRDECQQVILFAFKEK